MEASNLRLKEAKQDILGHLDELQESSEDDGSFDSNEQTQKFDKDKDIEDIEGGMQSVELKEILDTPDPKESTSPTLGPGGGKAKKGRLNSNTVILTNEAKIASPTAEKRSFKTKAVKIEGKAFRVLNFYQSALEEFEGLESPMRSKLSKLESGTSGYLTN